MIEILSRILYMKELAAKGLRLAERAEGYVAGHPLLIWGLLALAVCVLAGVAVYKGMHRKVTKNTVLTAILMAGTLAGTLPGMNAYFTDQATSSVNVIQAASILYHYTTGGQNNAVTYEEQHQSRSMVWIKNNETSKVLVIQNIQLIHLTFQQAWIEEIWASPQHSQASEGKPRNATIGPGEKRWIWMRIDYASATRGQYDNATVRLTVNGSTIDIQFKKIIVARLPEYEIVLQGT